MSRLDSAIRRLEAQRRVLGWAMQEIAARYGPILELGLGNGRTFDHLRENLPGRALYAFDRVAAAHPNSMPEPDRLILGDMHDTLPAFAARHGRIAALVHVDATTGVPERDSIELAWLPGHVAALVADGGIVASGSALDDARLEALALPEGVAEGRYWVYRRMTGEGGR